MDGADRDPAAAGLASVAEERVPVHHVALVEPASQGPEVPRQAHVFAVAGLDGDEDTVVSVGLVASGEGHAPAIEGGPDRVPQVHEIVHGELVVRIVRFVAAAVSEVAVGVLAPEVGHADSSPALWDVVVRVTVGCAAVLDLHPEPGVGAPATL